MNSQLVSIFVTLLCSLAHGNLFLADKRQQDRSDVFVVSKEGEIGGQSGKEGRRQSLMAIYVTTKRIMGRQNVL